jgi:hypothetical protein
MTATTETTAETTTTPKAPARKRGQRQVPATDAQTAKDASVLNGITAPAAKSASKAPARKATPRPKATAKPTAKAEVKPEPKPTAKTDPKPEPEKAKAVRPDVRGAKQDLANRVLLAIADMFDHTDGSEAFRAVMSKEDAMQTVAQWVHHLPTGSTDGRRNWPSSLPRPDRSDWR